MANLKDTSIKYINKDMEGFKRDLMRYAQAHFSGAYQDYNEASPGMMVLELQAYVADVLSYYMDQQFLEIRQTTARQLENIEEFAKMRGYKPRGVRPARVVLDFIVEVPAALDDQGNWVPDPEYLPILRAGTQAQGPNGNSFETLEDLDFGVSTPENPQQAVVSATGSTGHPTKYAVRRHVDAVAGKTVTENVVVGDFVPFRRIQLGQTDVQEVIDVIDREGQPWFEVDYLAQNAVFDQSVNTDDDSDTVPYVLRWRSASRRFVVDYSPAAKATYLKFGSGDGLKFDDELIPNVANLALPLQGRPQFTNFVLDPQNFLKTRTLGLSPYNTTLTIRYRVGGGTETNVPAMSIDKVALALVAFKVTSNAHPDASTKMQAVRASIEVFNQAASEGGGPAETSAEIKANADSFFAAQCRAVTKEDFLTQILSMPSRFGRAAKAYIKNSEFNAHGVDVHLLSLDPDGHLQKPTATLKSNVQTYLKKLRMMTEGVTILDANVVNLGIRFGVVISPLANRAEVLTNCLTALKAYFDTDNMQIGMPIVISDVEAALQAVSGVIGVYKLEFQLKWGSPYAEDIHLDLSAATKNRILYCPEDTVFEVRFPDRDITGESK